MTKFLGIIFTLMCLMFIGTQTATATTTPTYTDTYSVCDDGGGDMIVNSVEFKAATCEVSTCILSVSHAPYAIITAGEKLSMDCPVVYIRQYGRWREYLSHSCQIDRTKPPVDNHNRLSTKII